MGRQSVNEAAYRLSLAFLAWVDDSMGHNRRGWMWSTKGGECLFSIEHIAAALQSGDLAPLPGVMELPRRYLELAE